MDRDLEQAARWLVDAYRFYYANENDHLFKWSRNRERPPWIEAYTLNVDVREQ